MDKVRLDTSLPAIGNRLQLVRRARGFATQAAFASALQIEPNRYFTYESGRSTPRTDILARIWQLTGATSDYVLFGRMDGLPYDLVLALTALDEPNGETSKSSA